MKKFLFVVGVLVFVLCSGITAYSQDISIPGMSTSAFASYLADQPPKIYEVKQTPTKPSALDEVKITAKIANDIEKTDDTTISAYLFYSIDEGKTWEKIDLEQDEKDETLWHGVIPAQKAGTKVIYYLQGVDTAGNKTSEMPGVNTIWPPVEKDKAFPILCDGTTDADEDSKQLPDEIDILGLGIGYDDKYLYGKLTTQGNISGGQLSPTQINAYAVGCLNPDRGEDILKGAVLAYVPLVLSFPVSAFNITKEYFMIDHRVVNTKQAIPEQETGADAYAIGNTLYFRFLRSLMGANPSGQFKFLGITGFSTTLDVGSLMQGTGIVPGDASTYIYVYLRNHTYTVK